MVFLRIDRYSLLLPNSPPLLSSPSLPPSFPPSLLLQMRGPRCPPDACPGPGPPLGASGRRAAAWEELGRGASRTQALQCPEEIPGERADGAWELRSSFLLFFWGWEVSLAWAPPVAVPSLASSSPPFLERPSFLSVAFLTSASLPPFLPSFFPSFLPPPLSSFLP